MAVGRVAVVILTLSVSEAVNVTVWVWELVFNEIVVSSALKLLIVGAKLSLLLILVP